MKTIDVNMVLGQPGTHVGGVSTAHELIEEMDRQQIERSLVSHLGGAFHNFSAGNDPLLREMRAAGGHLARLVPVPVANPDVPDGGLDWDAWQELGAKGVRICPTYYHQRLDTGTCKELLGQLRKRNWFLQVPIAPFCGAVWQTGSVAEAVRCANLQEDLPVLILCANRHLFGELRKALASCPNICLDVGNLSTGAAVATLVGEGYGDRLVCGSGYGVSCSTPFRDMVIFSSVPESAKALILYGNAARLIAAEERE